MAAPAPTDMVDFTPTDRPSRNTRRQTRLQPRVKQLRAQYPLRLLPMLPYLSVKERQDYIDSYEQELLDAAEPDATTLDLGYLALTSTCGRDEEDEYRYERYLPHLHCITDFHFTCKSCRKADSDYDSDYDYSGDDSCVSESEHELEFNRVSAQHAKRVAEEAASSSSSSS